MGRMKEIRQRRKDGRIRLKRFFLSCKKFAM